MAPLIGLVLLFVAFAGWLVWSNIKIDSDEQHRQRLNFQREEESRKEYNNVVVKMPNPVARGVDEWVLNPGFPLKITAKGLKTDGLQRLNDLLNDSGFNMTKDRKEQIRKLLTESSVELPEIEEFLREQQTYYRDQFDLRIANHEEWDTLSFEQQSDLSKQFLRDINVQAEETPCLPLHKLLEGSSSLLGYHVDDEQFEQERTIDREMGRQFVKRYGVDLLDFYVSLPNFGEPIKADNNPRQRKMLDRLYEEGLAKKGQDISLKDILNTYSVEKLKELAFTNHGMFATKQDVVNYIYNDALCREKAVNTIPYRYMYQPLRIDEIEPSFTVDELAKFKRFYDLVSELFITTYHFTQLAHTFKNDQHDERRFRFFVKRDNTYCGNICKRANSFNGRIFTKKRLPDLPLHVGCTCVYSSKHIDELSK